jgi:hypothetical protein
VKVSSGGKRRKLLDNIKISLNIYGTGISMACFQECAEWPTLILSSQKFRVPLYSYEHYIPDMDLSLYIVHCLGKNKLMYQSWAVSFSHSGKGLVGYLFPTFMSVSK